MDKILLKAGICLLLLGIFFQEVENGSVLNMVDNALESATKVTPEEVAKAKKDLKSVRILVRDKDLSKEKWHPLPLSRTIKKKLWNDDGEVKMVLHGFSPMTLMSWKEQLELQGVYDLGNELAKLNVSNNVLLLNWTIISTTNLLEYQKVAKATPFVGDAVTQFLIRHFNKSYIKNWDKVHVMGLSLGAHVSGIVGNRIQKLTGGKLGRITGMDPAGPLFDINGANLPKDLTNFLDKTDAKFVDVIIHTNMKLEEGSMLGHFGSRVQSGHVDFYPDGGVNQDCCSIFEEVAACSHRKSVEYMKRSIKEEFTGCHCKDWDTYKEGNCNCTVASGGALMGYPCSQSASGKYFLSFE